MSDAELYEVRDVRLRKLKRGEWEVGYQCPVTNTWSWGRFDASTLAQAQKKARPHLVNLIRRSCDLAESRAASMLELAKAISTRATRTADV